jgi:hypothetical protein
MNALEDYALASSNKSGIPNGPGFLRVRLNVDKGGEAESVAENSCAVKGLEVSQAPFAPWPRS